jgi:hypothetical protein
VPNKRRSKEETKKIDTIFERLRDFLRLNYISYAEVAKRIGVRDYSLSSWLTGKTRPAEPDRITNFLDSLPAESDSGIAPTGYRYQEYKNWRSIPKPQRCPFCKRSKGEIRKARGPGFSRGLPYLWAIGPKRENHDEALRAWNGESHKNVFYMVEPAYVDGNSHASTPDSSFQSGLLRSEGLTVACTTSAASRVMFVAPILPLASNAASINRWHTLMWLYVGFCDPQSGMAAKNGIRTRTSWCGTWDWPGYEVSGLIFWVDSPKVRSFLSCDDIEIVAFDNLSRVIGFES